MADVSDEEVGGGDEGGVAVPAVEGAAFEVGEAGFKFWVVVLDSSSHRREPNQGADRGVEGEIRDPVVGWFNGPGGPFEEEPLRWSELSSASGMSRLAALTRKAKKRDRMASVRLPGSVFVPLRQVTWSSWRRSATCASSRN